MIKLTPRAQKVVALARQETARFGHRSVDTEHMLLGIFQLDQGVVVHILKRRGLNAERVRLEIEKITPSQPILRIPKAAPFSPRFKKVLTLAAKEAKALHHSYTGTEHLLLGLMREEHDIAAQVLKVLHFDLEGLRGEVFKELNPSPDKCAKEIISLIGPDTTSVATRLQVLEVESKRRHEEMSKKIETILNLLEKLKPRNFPIHE